MTEMNDEEFLKMLQETFISEATLMLDDFDEALLRLEAAEDTSEQLNRIFRVLHSVKGSARSVGFVELANFSHCAEDLLGALRIRPEALTPESVSILLQVSDIIKNWIPILNDPTAPAPSTSEQESKLKSLTAAVEGNNASAQVEQAANLDAAVSVAPPADHSTPVTADSAAASALPNSVIQAIADGEAALEGMSFAEQMAQASQSSFDEGWPPLAGEAAPAAVQSDAAISAEAPVPAVPEALPSPTVAVVPAAPTPSPAPSVVAKQPAAPEQNTKSKKSSPSTVVKVDSERIDILLNVVGEIVVLKGQLLSEGVRSEKNERLLSLAMLMDKSIRDLQDRVLAMRMTSLKPVFLKLQRGVRDVALKLGKDVEFEMKGEDTEIDRTLIDLISDPLMHVVRNAVDHGLETTEKRLAANKPAQGKVMVTAERRGGRMMIEVRDNGGGISREKIAKKAIERGLLSASTDISGWPDKNVFEFLMQPGFSTAEVITDVSGRGVGLDVVRSNLEEIKGRLEIESVYGKGSCFRLSIPLTTAIIDAMLVKVLGSIFIIPIDAVQEFVQLSDVTTTRTSTHTRVVNIRGSCVPVFHLQTLLDPTRVFESDDSQEDRGVLVIVHDHDGTIALQVDKVIGQSQIVVKGLAPALEGTPGISAAAQLEDGNVGLILDIEGLHKFLNNLEHNSKRAA